MHRIGKLFVLTFILTIMTTVTVVARDGKVYAWGRIYTATQSGNTGVTESAFYTSIDLINATEAEKAKQNVLSYFNAKVVPHFANQLKLTVKDVQIKTFSTLEAADEARYAVFQKDKQTLNPKADNDYWSTLFFNCSLADGSSRAEWMSEVDEVQVAGVPIWKYFKIEVTSFKKSAGDDSDAVDQRFYFSEPFEVYVVGSDSRKMEGIFSKYFETMVEQPMIKKHGFGLRWYEDQKEILPGYVRNDVGNTYKEAKADLQELIENRKDYGMAMFTFNFSDRGTNQGELTSQPKCFANCEKAKAPLTASQPASQTKTISSGKKPN